VSDPIATLRAELRALERAYSRGHHGRWSARRRSDLMDACLVALWERAGAHGGVALAALGGYGRRLQLPHSDVDVLLVHDGVAPDEVERLTHAMLYPLWDAGFSVGQAVRTPDQCLEAAAGRLDVLTSMLDARALAGDERLVGDAMAPVHALVTDDPPGFAERLRDAAATRRERYGSAAHLLEPELKEGGGGLRDVASIGWLQSAVGGSLERAGVLRPREREALDDAEEFLVRVRSALHLEAGRRADRLVLDEQPDIARVMGFSDQPRLLATDGLMRALFEHARQVEHVLGLALDRVSGRGDDGAPLTPPADAAGVLEVLARLADRDAAPSPALLDAIEAADVPDPVPWTPELRDLFMRLLARGAEGVRALESLDRLGMLARYLPAWTEVRCRPQRDPYHRFTVDAHLTGALVALDDLLTAPGDDDPALRGAVDAVDDLDGLRLGTLFHDIGKVGEGNHVPAGARIARETLDLMGVPPPSRDLAVFMVAEHLLLPDTATRRDLTDENLILDAAARIGTPQRLAALYLLARADAAATGPAAWTPWRRTLIHELVAKVQHVLHRGEMGIELAARLADRIDRVRSLLSAGSEPDVDAFVLRMPRGYFLTVEPTQVARHFATVTPHLAANDVRTTSVPGARPGTYELLVVAHDRPGLLSWIAGSLAVTGISILSAQVFTTDDGVAVDLFEVEGAYEPEVTESRWRSFRATLRRTIDGSISLERRVEERRRTYPAPRARTDVTMQVDNDASDFSTIVEVGAPDRIGLLYDVTRAFADLQIDVHLAKVATYDGRVVDAFYVRDGLGRKITDEAQLDEIRESLEQRLTAA
jgi:[protein-PII] uridylyltransferase